MKRVIAAGIAATITTGLVTLPAVEAADAATTYKNCSQFNKKHPHGVGKKGAKDKTSGKRVTNFKVDSHLYWLYSSSKGARIRDLDRDNDGISCEKR